MPNLIDAKAWAGRKVRATFSGALADLTTGTNGACNPDNWTLTGDNAATGNPVAPVTPVSVEEITTSIVEISLSDDFSPGELYIVVAKGAAAGGITGVPMAPDNTVNCSGFEPVAPASRRFDVMQMLPSRALEAPENIDMKRLVQIFAEQKRLSLDRIDRWTQILDYERAPENFVDIMLRALGNPFAIALTLLDKRRLAGALLGMYRQAGTAPGIREACRFFTTYPADVLWGGLSGFDWSLGDDELGEQTILGLITYQAGIHGTDLLPLFLSGTTPYHFIVKVGKGSALTAAEEEKVAAVVEAMRPAHTHVADIIHGLAPPETVTLEPLIGQIQLNWSAVPGAVGYTVFWSNTPIVSALSPSATITVGTGYAPLVPSGRTRYFVVAARDASGNNGVASPPASATAL